MMSFYPAYVAQSPDDTLAYPHYSDERWRTPRLIYGRECKTTESNYSDRLWQWGYHAGERASAACEEAGLRTRTARRAETWLSAYHGRRVILRYILGGVNFATGYEYYFYGYDYEEPPNAEP